MKLTKDTPSSMFYLFLKKEYGDSAYNKLKELLDENKRKFHFADLERTNLLDENEKLCQVYRIFNSENKKKYRTYTEPFVKLGACIYIKKRRTKKKGNKDTTKPSNIE